MGKQGKNLVLLLSLFCGLLISGARPGQDGRVTLSTGGMADCSITDFRRDGEIILLPFKESLEFLGLSGFSDYSVQALFIKAAGKLLVVDIKSGETACESDVYKLSRPPLIETSGSGGREKIWLPQDFFTGPLAGALGGELKVRWEKPEPANAETDIPFSSRRDPVNVIVIDPGHGGENLGAEGPYGLLEKEIVLELAMKLKDDLAGEKGLSIILTRTTDVDIDLDKRARIANAVKADLFISLHVNAAEYMDASGFETFFLSLEATDEAARKLAWLENQGMLSSRIDSTEENPDAESNDLELILGDMAQSEHLQDSEFLAGLIQENLAKVMNSENRGVKQAPFRVLMGANMPAVLVEAGFLTNHEEARNISDSKNQEKIVKSIAKSIVDYRRIQEMRQGLSQKESQ